MSSGVGWSRAGDRGGLEEVLVGEERSKQRPQHPNRRSVVRLASVVALVVGLVVLPEAVVSEVGSEVTEEGLVVEVGSAIKVVQVVEVVVVLAVDRVGIKTVHLLSTHRRVQVEGVGIVVGMTTAGMGTVVDVTVVATAVETAVVVGMVEVGIDTRTAAAETITILESGTTTVTATTTRARSDGTRRYFQRKRGSKSSSQPSHLVLSVWYIGGYCSSHVFSSTRSQAR